MPTLKPHLLLCLISLLFLDSCSSGKKAYLSGNYYEAVITSTNRLRRDANHSKSIETLREAYPLAVSYYDDRAKAALASNAEFKWSMVVESYTTINVMYDEIRRSPGALKVIPDPVNYYAKLDEAKRNAAEEKYSAGVLALAAGNRDKAKQAYRYFRDADGYAPGYKDVNEMIEKALWEATVKVVMEPIPVQSRNIGVSAEFFDNKVSEFLHSASINEFVRFFTRVEAQNLKLAPDHIIQIGFDEFVVGQVYMQEREVKLEKDSVVVGTYVASSLTGGGKPSGGDPSGRKDTKEPDAPGEKNPVQEDKKEEVKDDKKDEGTTDERKDDSGKEDDSFPSDKVDEKDQVTICHIPPGNETNRHTLVISRKALEAHLAHGDILGSCEEAKDKGKPSDQKPKENKGTEKKPDNNPKGNNNGGYPQAALFSGSEVMLASSGTDALNWLAYIDLPESKNDTVKIYATVKATLFHYRKTTTSKGILSFRIIDARTQAVLTAEKMPGEFVWISEWATFNGDERALSPNQLQLTKQREQVPPPPQDLFIEFTHPIFNQVTTKVRDFYRGY